MKKLKSLFLIVICCITFSLAQNAEDFTVIDTDGETHNCYEYLDAGKYIVLSFMYDG